MNMLVKRKALFVLAASMVSVVLLASQRAEMPDFVSGFLIGCLIVMSVFVIVQSQRSSA